MSVTDFYKDFLKGDKVIWTCFFLLIATSIVEMYSASSTLAFRASNFNAPITRHVMFLLVGFVVAYFTHRSLPYKYIPLLGLFLYVVSIALLIIVLMIGESTNNATRWISFFGVQFQPSELAKLSTIISCALFIGRCKGVFTPKRIWIFLGMVMIPTFLILLDNLSTAAMLFVICLIMLFCAGISLRELWTFISSRGFVGVVCAVFVIGLTYFLYTGKEIGDVFHRAETWQNRFVRFYTEVPLDSSFEVTDYNRQSTHAKIAISNGRYSGLGIGDSEQRDFLPHAFDDFIFAIIVEETGLFSLLVIALYLGVFSRCLYLIYRCDEPILCYTLLGISLMLLIQAYFHVAVSLGCVPVTGQPLPIISRGGTSCLVGCLSFGLLLCISRYIYENPKESSSNGRQRVDKSKREDKEVQIEE